MTAIKASTDGVGFWCTDKGNWNANGEDLQLYRCNGSIQWILYYEPYDYPHPLAVSGANGPPAELIGGSSSCMLDALAVD